MQILWFLFALKQKYSEKFETYTFVVIFDMLKLSASEGQWLYTNEVERLGTKLWSKLTCP